MHTQQQKLTTYLNYKINYLNYKVKSKSLHHASTGHMLVVAAAYRPAPFYLINISDTGALRWYRL